MINIVESENGAIKTIANGLLWVRAVSHSVPD